MTFQEAAAVVLRDFARPMTANEITEVALARGLLKTRGKTPEATMSATLYRIGSDGPIRREYQAGRGRAVRGTVRWSYGPSRP